MHRLRLAATAAICLTMVTVSCGEDDDPSSNSAAAAPVTEAIGRSTVSTAGSEPTAPTTVPRVPPVGAYGAGWSEIGAGIGYLELSANGRGRVLSLGEDLAGPREDRFTYELAGDFALKPVNPIFMVVGKC